MAKKGDYIEVYTDGHKGRRYKITFFNETVLLPWGVEYHGASHWFVTLREALAYCAGRGFFGVQDIDRVQRDVMQAFDKRIDEPPR